MDKFFTRPISLGDLFTDALALSFKLFELIEDVFLVIFDDSGLPRNESFD